MSIPSSQSTVILMSPASSPLIITSALNLIPDEKLKWPKAIRSLVEIEVVKNYLPPTITSAVKEYVMLELGLGELTCELKRKEVANIKYKVHGPAETHLVRNLNLKLDISESISYLTEQEYRIKNYCVSQRFTRVTSTNSLESFHSKLKKITSSSHGLIGVAYKVINIDCKKRSEAESASFDFRIKRIFTYSVDDDILKEIQKFPFPFQQLIIKKACAVMNRLEKGKKYVQTEQQKNVENRRIAVGELTERMCNRYWRVEEMGNTDKTQSFISMLETSVNLIISHFDDNSNEKT
ncbi:hypothetical protein C1645_814294 [Glomus cerebriforme]|uniref:Uncharacterized protein n=1 Tax=Glomus cerebriforme TaxID=658196 RepID=A0A397TH20_9GLOM|nr:hypothetical protein C1645_814294 [Glomus cerebriforme]